MRSNLDSGTYLVLSIPTLDNLTKKNLNIISIDPGITSMAYYAERRKGLDKYADTIRTQKLEVLSVKDITNNKQQLMYANIIMSVNTFMATLNEPDLVIIEAQLGTAPAPLRVSQTLITYFLINYPETVVVQINPSMKKKYLNCKNQELKTACYESVDNLLKERDDEYGVKRLNSGGARKHDKADAVLYSEVLWKHLGKRMTYM